MKVLAESGMGYAEINLQTGIHSYKLTAIRYMLSKCSVIKRTIPVTPVACH